MTAATYGKSGRERVARAIREHGPMPEKDIIKHIPQDARHNHNLIKVISGMLKNRQIICTDGLCNITPDMYAWLEELDEVEEHIRSTSPAITPPPYQVNFNDIKPISAKYIPSAVGTRGDIPRDVSFKNAGSDSVAKPYFRE